MKPGSKIQVLGAEKALFRSLQTNAPPPKHGVIFQIPILGHSPWWIRGKLARFIASKIAIAARADAFQGGSIGEQLAQQVKEKEASLRKQYPSPPPGKKQRVFKDSGMPKRRQGKRKKPSSQGQKGKGKGKRKKGKSGKSKKKGGA